MLIDTILDEIVSELAAIEATVAVVLAGSYFRGSQHRYSDVDVLHYVKPEALKNYVDYNLRYYEDTLVSLSVTTIDDQRARLTQPEKAIFAVYGLRESRVLYDTQLAFAALQKEAKRFAWNDAMQTKANAYASYHLMGYAEEAHKIMGGLLRDDESMTLYGAMGMVLGLTNLVATQRGLLFHTENEFFSRLFEAVGTDSAWSYYLRLAMGTATDGALPRMRGVGALGLYMKTVDMMRPILRPEHAKVVDKTWGIIAASGFNDQDITED